MIPLECPYCFARLEIGDDRGGKRMTCPFCKGQVDVPKPHKSRREEAYDIVEDEESAEFIRERGKLTAAEIQRLEDEEEPEKKKRRPKMEWQLFIGGFGFPWSPGAVMQWLLIAIWATIAGWLAWSAVDLGVTRSLGAANMYQTIVALLAGLGGDPRRHRCYRGGRHPRPDDPPGNDRRQRSHGELAEHRPFSRLDRAVMVPHQHRNAQRGIGPGTGMVATGARPSLSATVFFLFPILLLCTLETDSPLVPISTVVLASLFDHAIAWLAFYAQSAGLLAVAMVLVFGLGPRLDPRAAVPLGALLFSAVVMIYFRLLGRLAFYCSTEPEEEEVLE